MYPCRRACYKMLRRDTPRRVSDVSSLRCSFPVPTPHNDLRRPPCAGFPRRPLPGPRPLSPAPAQSAASFCIIWAHHVACSPEFSGMMTAWNLPRSHFPARRTMAHPKTAAVALFGFQRAFSPWISRQRAVCSRQLPFAYRPYFILHSAFCILHLFSILPNNVRSDDLFAEFRRISRRPA